MNHPTESNDGKRTPNYDLNFPSEVDPYLTEDHILYARKVEIFNSRLQKELTRIVESNWDGQEEQFAITTTGSDGRLEKGTQSKMELMIIHHPSFDPSTLDRSLSNFYNTSPQEFWQVNELKKLNDPSKPISGYHANPSRLFPTRLFDAELIGGNPQIFFEALEQQEAELTGPLGERCLSFLNDRRRDAFHVIKQGSNKFKGENIIHFDLDKGVSYYGDPHLSRVGSGSFKFGPLRGIQYRMGVDLIRMYRAASKYGVSAPFTLDDIPNNTPERLLWLETGGYTTRSNSEISSLVDNYCFFLKAYHQSQWSYKHDTKTEVGFNRAEVRERLSDVVKLLEKPIIAENH